MIFPTSGRRVRLARLRRRIALTFHNDTVTVISDTFINPLSAARTAWKDRMDRFDGSIIGTTEAQRYERAKQTARDHGFILLTPRACAYLYDVSPNTLRQAWNREAGAIRAEVGYSGKAVPLIRWEWAEEKWAAQAVPERLDEMIVHADLIQLASVSFLVLHPTPVVVDRYPPGGGTVFADDLAALPPEGSVADGCCKV